MKIEITFSQAVAGYFLAANARHLCPNTITQILIGSSLGAPVRGVAGLVPLCRRAQASAAHLISHAPVK